MRTASLIIKRGFGQEQEDAELLGMDLGCLRTPTALPSSSAQPAVPAAESASEQHQAPPTAAGAATARQQPHRMPGSTDHHDRRLVPPGRDQQPPQHTAQQRLAPTEQPPVLSDRACQPSVRAIPRFMQSQGAGRDDAEPPGKRVATAQPAREAASSAFAAPRSSLLTSKNSQNPFARTKPLSRLRKASELQEAARDDAGGHEVGIGWQAHERLKPRLSPPALARSREGFYGIV